MAAILFKWLMTGMVAIMHPFYVSVTDISHNDKDKTLEISVKLFIDDFETSLGKTYNQPVDLGQPKDATKVNQQIFEYLQQHLQVSVNGKPVRLEFVGYERERESAWCYVQVNDVNSVAEIQVRNTLLYDSFDKQINIMHVNTKGVRKSTRLNYPDNVAKFGF
jgi:hypothetical protein